MLYIVVERFRNGSASEVYRRAAEKGRMLPAGLEYVDSWVSADFTVCFQLMRTDNRDLFHQWMREWEDLVDFEIIEVQSSEDAFEAMRSGNEK
jgi:hypothetical protein